MVNGYGLKRQPIFLLVKHWLKLCIILSLSGCQRVDIPEQQLQKIKNIEHNLSFLSPCHLRQPDFVYHVIGQLRDADQIVRHFMIAYKGDNKNNLKSRLLELDELNQKIVNRILEINQGWLLFQKFGKICEENLWLLIQHAPDIDFQKKVLKTITCLYVENKVQKSFIFTCVALRMNQPQLCGTQVMYDPWVLYSTQNKKDLEKRRQAMELPLLDIYLKQIKKLFKTNLS